MQKTMYELPISRNNLEILWKEFSKKWHKNPMFGKSKTNKQNQQQKTTKQTKQQKDMKDDY